MNKSMNRAVPILLGLSAFNFAILIPGGPIETRSFANYDATVLVAFSTFLTALGLASLVLVYVTYKGRRTAFVASALCGLGYFLVYVLDLGRIFPVSPDPMPSALWGLEVSGTIISMPLMLLSVVAASRSETQKDGKTGAALTKVTMWLGIPIVLVGLAIVIFATYSAMRR